MSDETGAAPEDPAGEAGSPVSSAPAAEAREARGGILVVGGGFAGSYVARFLGRRGCTIVSPENFMLFTPILPEAASGTLEPRHVVVPLRQMCPHADVILGSVRSIDLDGRAVEVESTIGPLRVSYEELVLAVGAVTRTLPVPGLAEHGLGFKDLADAIRLRNHVLRELEAADAERDPAAAARHLGFVFVGAGYAGVEALGELHDLVQDALRAYPRVRGLPQRWVLVDASPRILPEVPSRLGEYARRLLLARGIEIYTDTTLERVGEDDAELSNGARIPTHTLVWTTGVRANPLLEELGLPLAERGRVRVDEYLRVEGVPHVWALGDCAAVPNRRTGAFDPPTSQHALRQARRLARNLQGELEPYGYRTLGQVATLGRYKGIAAVLGVHVSGFPGWFLTRTYHLFQMPLLTRKLRIVADWTIALLFRRDIAELSMLGQPRRLE